MFKKLKLKNKISKCKKEIVEFEKKRYRSQANLVEAILLSKKPDNEDIDYFNKYTESIEQIRRKIHEYQEELGKLRK